MIGAGARNLNGEWGVFSSPVPADIKRLTHRDALWLSLAAGQPGFMQWTYEFPDEYKQLSRVVSSLPKEFSPARPAMVIDIGEAWKAFQDNTRYPLFQPGKLFAAFPFNRQKQADANLQKMLQAYRRSLEFGVPITFTMDGRDAVSPDDFAAMDLAKTSRPVHAEGGYDSSWLMDANSRTWVAYFRNRKVQCYGRHCVGVPHKAPLEIVLDLPDGTYRTELINLTRASSETRPVRAHDRLRISENTTDDYVLVIR
jgi:hypothetical protein